MLRRYNSNTSINSSFTSSTNSSASTINASSMSSYDQQSLASSRKGSRLSNLNLMKGRGFPNKGDNYSNSNATYQTINVPNSPYYNLTPMSTGSDQSLNNQNYHLTKMETNESIDSNFSLQAQFKIELNLNKKDTELIRYTWNKMLLDEPVAQTNSKLPIPGGFNFNGETTLQQEAARAHASQQDYASQSKVANNIASSLFCRQLYSNLLSMDPGLEKLFPSIKHQAVAFAGVMSFTISQLENLTALNDYLENLGKRHSRILGIEPSMFELMGEAMVQTFHERFGNRFTQDLEILWIKLYLYLANSLLQFGIDPILRLNRLDSNTFEQPYQQSNMFKMNESNQLHYQSTNGSKDNSDLFSIADDRKSSVASSTNSLPDVRKDKSALKKKKRDCVIQ